MLPVAPLISEGAGLDEPKLRQVPGYAKLLGFTNSLDLTSVDVEVAASCHALLLGEVQLLNGVEITAMHNLMAHKETDMHVWPHDIVAVHGPLT